jgi:hypothetical protein
MKTQMGYWCHLRELGALDAVIPAKAGIHLASLRKCAVDGLDSRFRGNDWRFESDPMPNDANARIGIPLA